MKRVLLIAPINSSAFAICILLRTAALPDVEIAGVIVRRITIRRALQEWRRDGLRLLRKFWTKHLIRDRGRARRFAYVSPRQQLDRMGLRTEGLAEVCRNRGWPLLKEGDLGSARVLAFVNECSPTIAVFAGGGMIRAPLIEGCGDGVLNCHMGPLPRYRGMDVVEWPFIEEGRHARPAVTVHFMDSGLDTGPIVEVAEIPLAGCRTVADIRASAEGLKIEVLVRAIEAHRDGTIRPVPQTHSYGRQYFVLHPILHRIAETRARMSLDSEP